MARKIIPQEHKDKMVKDYISGMSQRKAARQFGYTSTTCLNELKKRNIKSRSRINNNRKYTVNQKFFDKIDTEEKAYWLGFITADGSVNQKCLSLDIKDREHLEKFIKDINSKHPIKKNRTTYNIRIFSANIVRSLNKLGIHPGKTFTVKPYTSIPDNLIRHYWRGIFDGDGCICKTKNNKWTINLVGNQFIVNSFDSWIKSFVESRNNVRPFQNIWIGAYQSQKTIPIIIERIYKDSSIFLDRKRKLAQDILEDDHGS